MTSKADLDYIKGRIDQIDSKLAGIQYQIEQLQLARKNAKIADLL